MLAISFDTHFYAEEPITYSTLLNMPVITPLNNLFYNLETKNLAQHGLHPYYQHIVANLPQLLGPASLLLPMIPKFTPPLISAISGIAVLSLFQHQEARFLLPAIPLILSSVRLPQRFTRLWLAAWVVFNVAMGILMGMYHQGGVIPTQLYLASKEDAAQAFWWRTYSPPIWLLNGKNDRLQTTDLMGLQPDAMIATLSDAATCWNQKNDTKVGTYLVAPRSSTFLDQYNVGQPKTDLALEEVWTYKNHLNLDDLDFAEDGILATIKRVIGRRGLTTWRVFKICVSHLPSS
ncbi:MAG: alpha 1,2 mannosyltransferase [Candelina mexicana]|nr:MAG: alpha 1,2 mannosyltransferase [Candelina mexicana]